MNWKFASVVNNITSAEEDKSAAAASTEEKEDLQRTNLERRMEDAAEAAAIGEKVMKEAVEEA